ncbi:MAG: hypothetical protein EBQ92_10955 [Proteobacteria bacterium]|nr:hypothetical protein [Pseudomonadota bacterium]
MKIRKLVCFASLALSSWGWAYSDFVPLKERAQGHSLTGALQGNESVYSNPAGTLFSEAYTVDGTFAFPKSFSASIVDTRTNSVGGGVGYFKEQGVDPSLMTQGLRLTLGSRINQNLAVGIAGKAVWGVRSGNEMSFKDADAGLLWNGDFASLGMVIRNLGGGNANFKQERETSLGARIGYSQSIYISGSAHSKFGKVSPYEYGFGFEYISPWHFSLMAGYRFQVGAPDQNPSYWSTGISFLSPRLSAHYAVEFPQLNNEEANHLLGLSMAF